MAGVDVITAPAPTPSEVARSLTKDIKQAPGKFTKAELKEVHTVQAARQAEGSLGAFTALESARLAAETGDKQWEGARGKDIRPLFTGPNGDKVATLVEQANDVQRALEIIGLSPVEQDLRFGEMIGADLIDSKYPDANGLIETVCIQMAANKTFDQCFPMLQGMNVDAKAAWFREALSKMPSVRKAISESMANWQEKVFKFTDVPQTERVMLTNQKGEKETKATTAKTALESFLLTGLGIDVKTIPPMSQAALELAMTKGDVNAVRQVLLQADKFQAQEIVEIKAYEQKTAELAKNRELKKNPPPGADVSFITTEITRLEGETKTIPPKYPRYREVSDYTDNDVFKLNLSEYKSQTKDANDLAIKISSLPTNQNEIKLQIQRDREERAALESLKVDTFISKAIVAGYDEAEAAYALDKQSADAQRLKNAEQAGRMDEATMYGEKSKRWIEAKGDGHPETVHLDNIRTDLVTLKKDNKDDAAIKYFIARDAGLFDDKMKFKIKTVDNTGTTVTEDKTGEDIQALVQDGTISARQALAYLDTARYQRLTNLITTKADDGTTSDNGVIRDYRETLLMDYNRALRYVKQGSVGRAFSYGFGEGNLKLDGEQGNFELSKMEFKDLVTQLGTTNIDAAYTKDESIMRFIKKLEDKGKVSKPNIMAYVLMMIALGVLVPGVGALGAGAIGFGGVAGVAGEAAIAGGAISGAIGVAQAKKNVH